jgi:F-type H+-transporting ATPase subunit epsilon
VSHAEAQAKALRVELVTPEGPVLVEDARRVVVPGEAGELGVLPRHMPLTARLKAGETRVLRGDEWLRFATDEGYFRVQHDVASILVQDAVRAQDIDVEATRQALEDANARLAAAAGGDETVDRSRAERDASAAEARLRVAGGA